MVRALLLGLIMLAGAACSQETGAAGPRRIALVIGNSAYARLKPLPNVRQQVLMMAQALRQADFVVHVMEDFKWPEGIGEEQGFKEQLRRGDVCVVYYAGYAVQVAGDDSYLLPVNFDPAEIADMEQRAYHFKRLQEMLDEQGAALKIFILDASPRIDVPVSGVRAGDAGLMDPQIQNSKEMLYISAVFSNQWAPAVPEGSIGLLTKAAAQYISKPGLSLAELFDKVKTEVGSTSGQAQIPDIRSNVVTMQSFYFHEPIKLPPPKQELPPGFPATNTRDHEDYRWIPGGAFKMGCVPGDSRCQPNEQPQHEVRISHGFWMGRNEVQVSSYRRYLQAQSGKERKKPSMPSPPGDYSHWNIPDLPMVNVSWQDAQRYCQWAGARLPTEAEWEYAARAGQGSVYPFDNPNSRDKANFAGRQGGDIFDRVAPVHSFDPNAWGLNDMAGNVWEWVLDFYSETYFGQSPSLDPKGPLTGKGHVMRGGSFDSDAEKHLRISIRKEGATGNNMGFRCVLPDSPETNKLLGIK